MAPLEIFHGLIRPRRGAYIPIFRRLSEKTVSYATPYRIGFTAVVFKSFHNIPDFIGYSYIHRIPLSSGARRKNCKIFVFDSTPRGHKFQKLYLRGNLKNGGLWYDINMAASENLEIKACLPVGRRATEAEAEFT